MVIENWYLWETFVKGIVAVLIPSAIGLYILFQSKKENKRATLPLLIFGTVLQIPFVGYLGYWVLSGSLSSLIAGFPHDK